MVQPDATGRLTRGPAGRPRPQLPGPGEAGAGPVARRSHVPGAQQSLRRAQDCLRHHRPLPSVLLYISLAIS